MLTPELWIGLKLALNLRALGWPPGYMPNDKVSLK